MKHVERLEDLEPYEQDSGENISYQYVVKPGTMGLMSAGRVRLQGPTAKSLDAHDGWDQVYIVLSGSGTMLVNGEEHPIAPGVVVRVPKGTSHGVVLKEGESLEYVYVNAFANREALEKMMA